MQYYAPAHLAKDYGGELSYKLSATYVAFDASGTRMLVNMGGEQVYLFDVDNARKADVLKVPSHLPNNCNGVVHKPHCIDVSIELDLDYQMF